MSLTLTSKELEMLAAVLQEMKDIPSVDFSKVAAKTGQKYARNARSAFKKVWDKLKQGADETVDSENAKPNAKTAKATTKKTVGKTTAPRKASSGGPKTSKKSKAGLKKESENGYESADEDVKEAQSSNGSVDDEYEQELRDATFMGVSIEEWRSLSQRAPTPQGRYSDDED